MDVAMAVGVLRRSLDREPKTWKLSRCLRAIDAAALVREFSEDLAERELASRCLTEGMNQALALVSAGREMIARERIKLQEHQLDLKSRDAGGAFTRAIEAKLRDLAVWESTSGLEED